uniref:G-protein coupled receptors family 1 profile domain-containing protein n=1 Tax=Coturnix japonica TaxID=93934 RepID=A0A8C2T1X8_COTJA
MSTMKNCTEISSVLQDGIMLFQLIVYIPVLTLGLLLNTIAFWVFCCKLKRWTETRVYMINLMVADCSLLFALPFLIYFTKNKHPIDKLCFAVEMIYFTNSPMSIFIIMLIAIDRYIAIKFPLKAKTLRSPLKSACICGFLWIMQIGYSYCGTIFKKEREQYCFQKHSTEPAYLTMFSIWFFIPLVVVIYCSIQVIAELMRKKNENCHKEKLIRKAVYIVTANMAVFIVCFLPLYVGHLLRFLMDSFSSSCPVIQKINDFVHLASVLANTNCCLDAICYYFVSKEFQEASPKLARSKSDSGETADVQLSGITHQCQM